MAVATQGSSAIGAGITAATAAARRPQAAWALAAVLALYLGLLHLYLYWPDFPWWYNVAVAGLAAPAVLLFRLLTFWLPVLPGWLSFNHLTRKGAL